jgi:thiamine-phosphate pyrophosphorylase
MNRVQASDRSSLRARLDPTLYLVTDPDLSRDRRLADVVAAAVRGGVTLVQMRDKKAEGRALLGPDAILGASLDAIEQARVADPEYLDYVAFGPFAATATKGDAGAPIGAAGLAAVRALTALPLVAIGGLHEGNLGDVIRAGADGIAVVSAIMAAADPAAASGRLRRAIDAARKQREESA